MNAKRAKPKQETSKYPKVFPIHKIETNLYQSRTQSKSSL